MSTGASQIFVERTREALAILGIGGGGGEFLAVREEQNAAVQSGGFTSGSFQTRVLNTVLVISISGASLAANRITLPVGTYNIRARAPAFSVNRHKAKLRNITSGFDTLIGTSEIATGPATDANQTPSWVIGQFVLGEASDLELQHRCETTVAVNGFGVESNFGVIEVYSDVWLEKVA